MIFFQRLPWLFAILNTVCISNCIIHNIRWDLVALWGLGIWYYFVLEINATCCRETVQLNAWEQFNIVQANDATQCRDITGYTTWCHKSLTIICHNIPMKEVTWLKLCLVTNGHWSAALQWLPFILLPVFVQAAVIRTWLELIRPVCSLMRSINSFRNKLMLHQ